MRSAFYITVNDGYLGIGLAQARRLRALWQLDVHIFVEGNGAVERDQHGRDGIFVHRNLMRDLIPQDLPATECWPSIIYGRIFAPCLLSDYDRLIYLDADIFPMVAAPDLLELDLPGGLAAVQDGSAIGTVPRVAGSVDRDHWLSGIGVRCGRYFNSGMLLIDTRIWRQMDCGTALRSYMAEYGAAVCMPDQDFLNALCQDRWTQLSPRMNFQKALFNFGYEQVFPPVFLHFSSSDKPWLRDAGPDTAHGQFFGSYKQMFAAAGIDHRDFMRGQCEARSRRLRGSIRQRLTRLGLTTRKERRQRQDWHSCAERIYRGLHADATADRYADMRLRLDDKPMPALSFDGRSLRRRLDVTYTPVG